MLVLGLALPVLAAVGDTIVANDDVTVRGSTVYNNSDPFGLMAKTSNDTFYVEFTLGSTAVPSATLQLDNQYLAGAPNWDIGLEAQEYDFDDESFTAPTGAYSSVGTLLGVGAVEIVTLDITSWYNANLGKTMTIHGYTVTYGSGSAPIFDDSEGTLGGTAPAIVTIPEPTTLLLLSAGFGALIRRKR
jgi:hypothetical protein